MTAAFAWARGRDANQVNRLFSANPLPPALGGMLGHFGAGEPSFDHSSGHAASPCWPKAALSSLPRSRTMGTSMKLSRNVSAGFRHAA